LTADDPGDDFDLLVAYARSHLEDWADSPLDGDRGRLVVFDRKQRMLLPNGTAEADLAMQLDEIRGDDSGDARARLRALCASGRRDHSTIFLFQSCACKVLCFAYGRLDVDALVAAVHPGLDRWGQIASPDLYGGAAH